MTTHATVGELATQVRGVTFAKGDASLQPGPGLVPVIRAGNIQDGRLIFDDLVYVPEGKVSEKQRLRKNDVVVATSSGSIDVVGKAGRCIADFPGGFGAFLKVLRPGPHVDAAYFAHYFQTPSYRQRVSRLAAGANINNLRNEHLDDLDLPLPPLHEQRRIAAILDQADALRAKRRQVLAHLDALSQSIFHDMFGDPTLSRHQVPLSEIAQLTGGRNLVADDAKAITPYRVLKISAVTSGQYLHAESKPLPPGYVPPKSHLVRNGDLLMSRANTEDLVGAAALVGNSPPHLAIPDKIWRFDWNDPNAVPLYYHALFQSPSIRRRISRLASGTGGSMKNVSKAKLLAMTIPVVSVEDQRLFAGRAEQVARHREFAETATDALDLLFASVQSRAFRGEL